MKKICMVLALFFFIHSFAISTDITETSNLVPIESAIQQADSDTLVIFDVDDVLIMPTDEFAFKPPVRNELVKQLKRKYSKDQLKDLWSIIFERRNVKLVDPSLLKMIRDLEARKIPTVALTSWWTGIYGKISRMEDLRFKDLDQVGISFTRTSPFKEEMTFPEFKTEDGIPMVKFGVILTALSDKGSILKLALQRAKLLFKKIIFIDDDLRNLQSVEKICHEMGIGFQGFQYTAVNLVPLPKLEKEKEALRFKILETEHKWLSDEEMNLK